ncbi:hypothetical protein Pfo_027362 [Paulownia fortunei]|nr:hypothetical protein Pfo_027362 [Paulownia fortunei]
MTMEMAYFMIPHICMSFLFLKNAILKLSSLSKPTRERVLLALLRKVVVVMWTVIGKDPKETLNLWSQETLAFMMLQTTYVKWRTLLKRFFLNLIFLFFSFLFFSIRNRYFSNLTHVMFQLKEELFNIDDEGSQNSQGSIVGPNLLVTSPSVDKKVQKETFNLARAKQIPHCASFSVFEGEKFILNPQKEYIQKLWSDLYERIKSASIDSSCPSKMTCCLYLSP